MQKITPFLWFDTKAEEAALFYISIFKNSKIKMISNYPESSPGIPGSVMSVAFQLEGQDFLALNGGPVFQFTPAISFFVDCTSQIEVDDLWDKLSAGGEQGQCAWLKDKFGISWQIVPRQLNTLLSDPDPVRAKKVMDAMLKMNKIDIAQLEKAYKE